MADLFAARADPHVVVESSVDVSAALLNLLASILVPHAAIGDVPGLYRRRRAHTGEIQ